MDMNLAVGDASQIAQHSLGPGWAILERNLLLKLASGLLHVRGMIFLSNNWDLPAERVSGGRQGRGGAWDFLIKLPSVIFGLPLSWDPKNNLHTIFTSQIFRASLALIFIYLFAKRNLNQTERHKSKTFEYRAKLIKTGSQWVEWNTTEFRERTMKVIRLWWEKSLV